MDKRRPKPTTSNRPSTGMNDNEVGQLFWGMEISRLLRCSRYSLFSGSVI